MRRVQCTLNNIVEKCDKKLDTGIQHVCVHRFLCLNNNYEVPIKNKYILKIIKISYTGKMVFIYTAKTEKIMCSTEPWGIT